MSEAARIEAELEARFGRPLTDEERAQLHENLARGVAAYVEAAAVADAVPPGTPASPEDVVWAGSGAADGPGYGSVRRSGPVTHPGARPAVVPGTTPGVPSGARPGASLRERLRRLTTPIVAGGLALAKWGALIFKLKFLGLFISIGAFQLLWRSWWLAIGFVALIFVHELGHMLEARRQGMPVTWPQFVPLVGAYVVLKEPAKTAFHAALVAVAGPLTGSVGAVACWAAAEATGSPTLKALAHLGIFINLLNLVPIGFLDGGRIVDALDARVWVGVIAVLGILAAVIHNGLLVVALLLGAFSAWGRWRQIDLRAQTPYYAIGAKRMAVIAALYAGLAALLVAGFEATNIPR